MLLIVTKAGPINTDCNAEVIGTELQQDIKEDEMSNSRVILVTGATGLQGGSVVAALMERGHAARGLTRNLESDSARALSERGIDVRRGEFTDPESLAAALDGVDSAFLVSTPFEGGVEAETEQAIAFVEAAKTAGIGHIVYSSVANADRDTGVPHFDSKYEVEKYIKKSGLSYTIVAPAFFYENHIAPFMLPELQNGAYAQAIPETTQLQMIAVANIGQFAALALDDPDRFKGKRIDIAGDAPTGTDRASILAKIADREIRYREVPIDMVRQMSEDMALMFEWFATVGYSVDIEELRASYTEIPWLTFEAWANQQDWAALRAAPVVS